jgi:hypothetical protein
MTDTNIDMTTIKAARYSGTTQMIPIPVCELQPGDVLRNGYVVVAVRARNLREAVVLAVRPDDSEYATWAVKDSSANTFWGHYEHDIKSAVEDFLTR